MRRSCHCYICDDFMDGLGQGRRVSQGFIVLRFHDMIWDSDVDLLHIKRVSQ